MWKKQRSPSCNLPIVIVKCLVNKEVSRETGNQQNHECVSLLKFTAFKMNAQKNCSFLQFPHCILWNKNVNFSLPGLNSQYFTTTTNSFSCYMNYQICCVLVRLAGFEKKKAAKKMFQFFLLSKDQIQVFGETSLITLLSKCQILTYRILISVNCGIYISYY